MSVGNRRGSTALYMSSSTNSRFPTDAPRWCGPHGEHLNLSPGPGLCRRDIKTEERSLWRYGAALRVDDTQRVSLGEGWTPLVSRPRDDGAVAFKLEYLAPTGSFKDRGMAVLMTYLQSVGVAKILEDSSGNAGASMAAYSAACGMGCRILVPADTPAGKLVQMRAMGADVVPVPGSRQDVADRAIAEAADCFYASHNWQPFFLEGTKTLAFELWEQLGFRAPDAVVVPLGYGSNVLGLQLGFSELKARGEVDRIPRIFGVQASNCSAFAAAIAAKADRAVPFSPKPTVAGGIASQRPVRVREVLSALRDTGGGLVTVSEEEIRDGLVALLKVGFYVEPTSASAAAGLAQLRARGDLKDDISVVVILTGSGLKATETIDEIVTKQVGANQQ
jgi:threonine synthase